MVAAFAQAGLKRVGVCSLAMIVLGPTRRGAVMPESARRRRASVAWLLVALVVFPARAVLASPFIWDQDGDKVDDRIETVHLLGYALAFERGDTLLRKR